MEPAQKLDFRKKQYSRQCWREHPECLLLWILVALAFPTIAAQQPADYFKIVVVDQDTGRGVPLVELRTTNDVSHYTDSNGIVAFSEPGLMGQTIYFFVKSDGYEVHEDFLGYRGVALRVVPGGSAVIKVKRTNIAERLYRITGQGIYRDSVLVGQAVPLKWPVLNGGVMGQDSGVATVYRGKIYWTWGDTALPSRALGNFSSSGATSELPGRGGLDPSVGIQLFYFTDDSGLTKSMCAVPGPGPKWLAGLVTVRDHEGKERIELRLKQGDDRYRVVGRLQGRKLIGDWTEINTGESVTWEGKADQSGMSWKKSSDIIPLYEYRYADGTRIYSTESKIRNQQLQRSADPICRVWRNPMSLLILDREAKPSPATR